MNTAATSEQFLVLLGQPPMRDMVHFIKTRSIDGHNVDEFALAQEWQRAKDILRSMNTDPSTFEVADLEPLSPHLVDRAEAALDSFTKHRSLMLVPHRWAMIDLDRVIIWQNYVNTEFSDRLRNALPASPTSDDLLDVVVGVRHEVPTTQVVPHSSTSFSFASHSTDLRVLGTAQIDPAHAKSYEPHGRATAVIAVYIGYGMNVMYAIHLGNRLMLINGTHRAYALRSQGITHIPCLIGSASSQDDLDLVGLPEQAEASKSYWSKSRPPLLRDYFDKRLRKTIQVARSQKIVELELKFSKSRMPTS